MSRFAIFDIDGTVVDSRHIITDSMAMAFKKQGLSAPDYNATRQIVGLSLEVAIDRLAPKEVDRAGVLRLVEEYKTAYKYLRETYNHAPLYEGIMDVILSLKDAGWDLGIATGKSRFGLTKIMDYYDLHKLFDCSYCADDGAGKPDPFMVEANLIAQARLPQHSVMIGDTSFDMLMGKAAGVHTIGVDWGFHTREELLQCGTDLIVSTMDELSEALTTFSKRDAV